MDKTHFIIIFLCGVTALAISPSTTLSVELEIHEPPTGQSCEFQPYQR